MQLLPYRSPVRALAAHMGDPLRAGQLGVIAAGAGTGKSALLVHLALDHALSGQAVLHVAVRGTVAHVRSFYEQLLQATLEASVDRTQLAWQVERHRIIHSYRDKAFGADPLRASIDMLREFAEFQPQLVVIDGLGVSEAGNAAAELSRLAAALTIPIWVTIPHEGALPEPLLDACFRSVSLVTVARSVRLQVTDAGQPPQVVPVDLDPVTLAAPAEAHAPQQALTASECTLYSGGAPGAELAFGEEAAACGLTEVNYTFEGHRQARNQGQRSLSEAELAEGDVSLVYVSKRLNRNYSQGTLIRKVLQLLWHVVSQSEQVFVIGQIQSDGTVVGGTGWSVELARMWDKPLWVFDQDQDAWFHWTGQDWVQDTPMIQTPQIAGSGTRYLKPNGRAAIRDLFARSFAGS